MSQLITVQKDKHFWPNKLDFFAYILILGNGSNLFPKTIFSLYKYSGGLLTLCLLLTAIGIALPMIYVELFFGKYTKKTNSLLYKACPLFIGLTIIILFMNCLLLPLETVAQSQFFLKAIWFTVENLDNICTPSRKPQCYDYLKEGPIKGACSYVPYGANCVGVGIVRYPYQYYYWDYNVNPDSSLFKQWQCILSLLFTWILITLLLFVNFRQVARFVKVCFFMQLVTNTIIFGMALYHDGSQAAVKKLAELKLDNMEETLIDDMVSMTVYTCKKYGLIIPIGYTTISAFAKFKIKFLQEAGLIITLDIAFTLFLCLVTGAVTGVIAHQMNIHYLEVLTNDVGLYFTVFPEFFRFVQVPWVFTVIYILIIGLCDFGRLALGFYLIFANIFNLIPTIKKFHTQIVVCYCMVCFIFTLLFTQQFTMNYLIPYIEYIFYHEALLLLLCMKATMIFYFYGIRRLSDDIYFMTGKKPLGLLTVIWFILPISLLMSFILELKTYNKIFGDILVRIRPIKFNTILQRSVEYVIWIIMCFVMFISIFYLIWSKNLGKPFLSSLKPDFYWGLPAKLHRMRRKTFSSTYGDRSKTTRRRKKLEKIHIITTQEEAATDVGADHEALEGIHQFQQYFKEIFRKQKKQKRKGRIFSDTTNFKNLDNAANIYAHAKYIRKFYR